MAFAALAGCGGGSHGPLSKGDYEREFKDVVARSQQKPALTTPEGASLRRQGEVADVGLDRIRDLASDLERLDPPRDVARAHEQLVSGLRAVADDGEKVVAAMKAGDRRKAMKLLGMGTTGQPRVFASPATLRKLAGARREFARRGYDLGAISQLR